MTPATGELRREALRQREAFAGRIAGRAGQLALARRLEHMREDAAKRIASAAPVVADRVSSPEMEEVLSALAEAVAEANRRSELIVLARQVALTLIGGHQGATAAAAALNTIPDAIPVARSRIAPIVAAAALPFELTAESFRTIYETARGREAAEARWSVTDVLLIASECFCVERPELLSARRTWDIVRPRQTAMWLAKRFTSRSFPMIGKAFGGRDHTTVLHAVRKVERIIVRLSLDSADDPRIWAVTLAAVGNTDWWEASR